MAPGTVAGPRVRIGIGIGSEWSKISNSRIDMRMLLGGGGNQILSRFALPALNLGRLCFLEGLGSPTQPWPAVLLLLSLSARSSSTTTNTSSSHLSPPPPCSQSSQRPARQSLFSPLGE